MSEAVLSVRISDPLLSEASLQAARAGVSIEEWLLSVAAERVRDEQVAERFFGRTPDGAAGQTMLEILDSANDGLPMADDEVPAGYRSSSVG
jgi:hypothetical protein